jgi:sporulation protein YlmC with PRC-barrel domain
MRRTIVIAASAALATAMFIPLLATSVSAQGKVTIPKGIFYAGLGPTQYFGKSRLIGQTVVDSKGAKIGEVSDVIVGEKQNAIQGLLLDAGGKRLGARISEFKIETKDGKTTISMPRVTVDMVKVLPAYQDKFVPKKK